MRALAAALAVLLLVVVCSLAEADLQDSSTAAPSQKQDFTTTCCFAYISHPIPRRSLSSAYWTSSSCLQPAVIFITHKGRRLCANPRARWVQAYLRHLGLLSPAAGPGQWVGPKHQTHNKTA